MLKELQNKLDITYPEISKEWDFSLNNKTPAEVSYGGNFNGHKITYKDLEYIKYKDNIKTEYAKNKNIKLLRIKYTEFDITEKILQSELK